MYFSPKYGYLKQYLAIFISNKLFITYSNWKLLFFFLESDN